MSFGDKNQTDPLKSLSIKAVDIKSSVEKMKNVLQELNSTEDANEGKYMEELFKLEKEIEAKIEVAREISVSLADEPEAKQWLAHLEQSKKAFRLTKEAVALRAQFCAVEVTETEENSVKLEQVEQAEVNSEERNKKLEGIKQVSGQIKEISDHLKESLVSQNQYLRSASENIGDSLDYLEKSDSEIQSASEMTQRRASRRKTCLALLLCLTLILALIVIFNN